MSRKIWHEFEDSLAGVEKELDGIPFVILVTPIAQFVEPEMKIHSLSRPKRFDCATIDPVSRLGAICDRLGLHLVNPTGYMKRYFENYLKEGNPERFYHLNDDNHINELGSRYFAEYSYMKIFEDGIIKVEPAMGEPVR